jgi:hypothetical protein
MYFAANIATAFRYMRIHNLVISSDAECVEFMMGADYDCYSL